MRCKRSCGLVVAGLLFTALLPLTIEAQEPAGETSTPPRVLEVGMPAWFEEQMFAPIEVAYQAVPLEAVMLDLAEKYELPLALDPRAPEIGEMEGDLPITLHVSDVPLHEALTLMLAQHELGWVVQDERLLVTLEELVWEYRFVTRLYLVSDLVEPVGRDEALAITPHDPDYEALSELILSTVAPTTWDEVGGVGSITYDEHSKAFLVSQTWPIHMQIELLLDKLREARAITEAQFPHVQQPLDENGLVVHAYRVTPPTATHSLPALGEDGEPLEPTEPPRDPEAYTDDVAETLVEFIAPESWEAAGGAGSIRSVAGWIFVRQSPAVHAQIREVLTEPAVQRPTFGAPFGGGAGF